MLGNDEFEAMSKNGVLKVAFPGVGVEGREADHFGVLLGVWGVQVGVEIEERKVEVSVGILPLHPEEVSSAFGSTRKFVGSCPGCTILNGKAFVVPRQVNMAVQRPALTMARTGRSKLT